MDSPMFKAFKEQQKYTDSEAIAIENQIEKIKEENYQKGMEQLSRSQDIRHYTKIPTKIQPDELNQVPNVHPNFKNYDHSLEKVRLKFTLEGPDAVDRPLSPSEIQQIEDNPFTIDWNSLGDSLS